MGFQMIQRSVLGLGLCAGLAMAGGEPDFGFDFVTIGDLGNPAFFSAFEGVTWGRGSVDYEYRISRTELTSGQYLEFFNLFLSDDPAEFFTLLPDGDSSLFWVGPGVPLRFQNGLNDPALSGVQVNWRQAAMFCNWMHNGQRNDWESLLDGVYDVSTFGPRDPKTFHYPDQAVHHPDARYWIPTLDEHLKAVYYDPDQNGNGPGWWTYGHSSDDLVIHGLPGEGEVARDIPIDVLRKHFGPGVRVDTIPLGIYPEVQSPWGLLDTLGGNTELMEDWENEEPRSRHMKLSNNDSQDLWGVMVDRVDFVWRVAPDSRGHGLRIASAVRHPADLNQDWSVNFFDISYFIHRFYAGDLVVDLDGDEDLDFDDVVYFLDTYNQ